MIEVKFQRGIELPTAGLWLDPWEAKPLAFVSHAHSDHIARHDEIIASVGTAHLMNARMPGSRGEHLLEFGIPGRVRDLRITLWPAGHIFGSAQLYLEDSSGSLLYTGDFKLRPGLSAEPTGWQHAETLIMETTYGLPKYRMPPTEKVLSDMVEFCRDTLEEGAVPVLLGYSLGKSQEILCALLRAGLTPMLHGAVFRMTEIYRQLQPDFPGGYVRYAPGELAGKVLVCPPSSNRSTMVTRIKNRRTAVLTGWALDPGATYRYGVDAAFPLTDHADYPDLLRYVELVQPKRVLTVHGFASAFARDLRERGIEAWALSENNQLELAFHTAKRVSAPASAAAPPSLPTPQAAAESSEPTPAAISSGLPQGQFHEFALVGEKISASSGKLKKIQHLSTYLRTLEGEAVGIAAIYLTGRAFSRSDSRVLQVGWSVIKRALLAVSKAGEQKLRDLSTIHRDAGKIAHEILLESTSPQPWSLAESLEFFDLLQKARGPLQKAGLLEQRLRALTPLGAGYLVRIITGDLRIGLKEGLVEESIAAAFGGDSGQLRHAHMLLGDIGETARLAANGQLHRATLRLFHPISCMLASPEPTADSIAARIADAQAEALAQDAPAPEFRAENKYDGIRAHLHIGAGRVEIFTRDLRRVSGQFPDLVRSATALAPQVILDGEIVAYSPDKKLTFFDLQRRLGRKTEDDLFLGSSDVPVIFMAFDLLYFEGRSLLETPLRDRRRQLETLTLPAGLGLAPVELVGNAAQIEAAFGRARRAGNEGLIIKEASGLYTPGQRGMSWLKFKKALATLDVVVVGAESGHGKRSQVLSDYTFAVRDGASGRLLTIGKAYSGLTDAEIEELTEHFKATTVVNHGRYREVNPEIVLEVAFDSVQPSKRHSSGLALRFPRIKAIRRDKSPSDIDSLADALRLVNPGQ